MGEIIDGKAVAARVRAEVAERVLALQGVGVMPTLAVVLVGDDVPSQIYVRHKQRACDKVGIKSVVIRLPDSTTHQELRSVIADLNGDDAVHAVLVQLPLPPQIHPQPIIRALGPVKDVDGFHSVNMGEITTSRPELQPCTPKGIMRLLKEYDVPLRGRHAVVIGRSRVVGRPMSSLLLAADATVTTCHRHTPNTAELCSQADVLVVATGVPEMVKAEWVKPGAAVIDVGITRRPEGGLVGDVDFAAVRERAALITPVPGGVGPMTIAMLLDNACLLAERAVRRSAR